MLVSLVEEMLNPHEREMVELDSVFQLKALVKKYYVTKGGLCD